MLGIGCKVKRPDGKRCSNLVQTQKRKTEKDVALNMKPTEPEVTGIMGD